MKQKTKYIKIALDVATKKTGYAVIVNNKYYESGVFDTTPKKHLIGDNYYLDQSFLINTYLSGLFWRLQKHIKGKVKFVVVIEYNLRSNSFRVSNMLTHMVGMYTQGILTQMVLTFPGSWENSTLKYIQAQEWQSRIQDKNKHLKGEYTKEHSLNIANAILKNKYGNNKLITSDDEAEAFIMSHFAEELRGKNEVKQTEQLNFKELRSARKKLFTAEGRLKKWELIATTEVKALGKNFKKTTDSIKKYSNEVDDLKKIIASKQKNKIWD